TVLSITCFFAPESNSAGSRRTELDAKVPGIDHFCPNCRNSCSSGLLSLLTNDAEAAQRESIGAEARAHHPVEQLGEQLRQLFFTTRDWFQLSLGYYNDRPINFGLNFSRYIKADADRASP